MNVGVSIEADAPSTIRPSPFGVHAFPDIEVWDDRDSLIPPHMFPVLFSRRRAVN